MGSFSPSAGSRPAYCSPDLPRETPGPGAWGAVLHPPHTCSYPSALRCHQSEAAAGPQKIKQQHFCMSPSASSPLPPPPSSGAGVLSFLVPPRTLATLHGKGRAPSPVGLGFLSWARGGQQGQPSEQLEGGCSGGVTEWERPSESPSLTHVHDTPEGVQKAPVALAPCATGWGRKQLWWQNRGLSGYGEWERR